MMSLGLLLLVARVVGLLRRGGAWGGAAAVAHCFPYAFKVGDRHQSARAVQRVTRFVPVGVVFATDHVQEVAGGKAEVAEVGVGVGVGRLVVVEGFYHLKRS
jgi:hypothetical protein